MFILLCGRTRYANPRSEKTANPFGLRNYTFSMQVGKNMAPEIIVRMQHSDPLKSMCLFLFEIQVFDDITHTLPIFISGDLIGNYLLIQTKTIALN